MAKVICAISGLELKISHFPMSLHNREMAHPIFYTKQRVLFKMYEDYQTGRYNEIDTYLLFLALLNSTDHCKFACPVQYRGRHTDKVVTTTIDALVAVMWKSAVIRHPSFKQPMYVIDEELATNSLLGIPHWIEQWETNLQLFELGYARERHVAALAHIEQKLEKTILSGTKGVHLAAAIAKWADKAAEFPTEHREEWMKTIRKCYNSSAMFNTPKKLLTDIKEYCEINIPVGTIHFHSLQVVLKEGIIRHNDFLGLGALSSDPGTDTYTLLSSEAVEKNNEAVLDIIAKAPSTTPVRTDYPSQLAFIRAKLQYKVYLQHRHSEVVQAAKPEIEVEVDVAKQEVIDE